MNTKNKLFILGCILFPTLLIAQPANYPVYNEPPMKIEDNAVPTAKDYNPVIPDKAVEIIVLKINQTVFPTKANPNDYLSPEWYIHSDNPEIIAAAKEITSKYSAGYDKVKAVHDWIAMNIYYDFDAYYANNGGNSSDYVVGSIDVLRGKKTVCSGYANLAAALLRSLGIPCRVVSGVGLGLSTSGKWDLQNLDKDTNHAWNEIYVSGKWIIMDVTWDSDLKYMNGTFNYGSGLRGHRYFDPTLENFSLKHRLEPETSEGIQKAENIKEDCIWKYVAHKNTPECYRFYMKQYPSGKYYDKCNANMMRQLKIIYDKRTGK